MVVSRSDAKRRKRPEVESLPDSPKRTKVHAQRKFAQGSHMNSPVLTPVKDKDKVKFNGSVANAELLHVKRPKTEEFVNFLCFRGSDMLPKSLEFFNKPVVPETRREQHSCAGPSRLTQRNNEKQPDQIPVIAKAEAKPRSKPKSIAAVQALKKKYQEQRKAKEKITLSKLALKVKGKNMMRTRSAGPLDEFPTSGPHKKPMKKNRLIPPAKSKVVVNKPTMRKHPPLKRPGTTKQVTRGGLRSGGTLPTGSDMSLKNERKPRKIFKFKPSVMTKNVKKPEIASSLSDFSSDDDQPLVKKQRVTPSASFLTTRVVTRSLISMKTAHPQLKRSIRPTRKTKEAATAYMEMLRKELGSPEDDTEEAILKDNDNVKGQKTTEIKKALKKSLARNKLIKAKSIKNSNREVVSSSCITSEKKKKDVNENTSNKSISHVKTRNVTKTLSSKEIQPKNIKNTTKVKPVSVTMSKTIPKDVQQVELVGDVKLPKGQVLFDANVNIRSNRRSKDVKPNSSVSGKTNKSRNPVENAFNDSDEEPLNIKLNQPLHVSKGCFKSGGYSSRNMKLLDDKEPTPIGQKTDKEPKDVSKELVKVATQSSNSQDIDRQISSDIKTSSSHEPKSAEINPNSESKKRKQVSNNRNKMKTRFEHSKASTNFEKDNNTEKKGKINIGTTNSKEINKETFQEKVSFSEEKQTKLHSSSKSSIDESKNKSDERGIIQQTFNTEEDKTLNSTEPFKSPKNSCKLNRSNESKIHEKSPSVQYKNSSSSKEEENQIVCLLSVIDICHSEVGNYKNKNVQKIVATVHDNNTLETFKSSNNKNHENTLKNNFVKKGIQPNFLEKNAEKQDLNIGTSSNKTVKTKEVTGNSKMFAGKTILNENENSKPSQNRMHILKPGNENKQTVLCCEAINFNFKEESKPETVENELLSPTEPIRNTIKCTQANERGSSTLLNEKINPSNNEIVSEITLIKDVSQSLEQKGLEKMVISVECSRNTSNLESLELNKNSSANNINKNDNQSHNNKDEKSAISKEQLIKSKIFETNSLLKINEGNLLELSQSNQTIKSNSSSVFQHVPEICHVPNTNIYSSEELNSNRMQTSTLNVLSTAERYVLESFRLPDTNEIKKPIEISSTMRETFCVSKGESSVVQGDKSISKRINSNNSELNKNTRTFSVSSVDRGSTGHVFTYDLCENKVKSPNDPKEFGQILKIDTEKQPIPTSSFNVESMKNTYTLASSIQISDPLSSNKTIKDSKNELTRFHHESEIHHEMSEKLSAVDSLMRLKNTKKFTAKGESSKVEVKFISCKKSLEGESKRQPSEIDNKECKRVKFQEPDHKFFQDGDIKRFSLNDTDLKHVQLLEPETKRGQLQDNEFRRTQLQEYKPKPEHSHVLKGCSNPKSMLKPGTLIDIAGISHSPEIMAPLRPGSDGEIIPMGKPIKLEAADLNFTVNPGNKVYDPKSDQHMSGYLRQTEKKRMFDQTDKDISDTKTRVPVNESAWRHAFKNVKDPQSNVPAPAEKQIIRKPALSVTALAKKHNKHKAGGNEKNVSFQPSIPFLRQKKPFFSSSPSKNDNPNKNTPEQKTVCVAEIDSRTLRQKEAEVEEFVRQYVTGELTMAFPSTSIVQCSSNYNQDKIEGKFLDSRNRNIENEETFLETKEIFHSKQVYENNMNQQVTVVNKRNCDELTPTLNQTPTTISPYSESIKQIDALNRKSIEIEYNNLKKYSDNFISTLSNISSSQYKEQVLNASPNRPDDTNLKTIELQSIKNENTSNACSNNLFQQEGSKNPANGSQNLVVCTKIKTSNENESSFETLSEPNQNIVSNTLNVCKNLTKGKYLQPTQSLKTSPQVVVKKSSPISSKYNKNVTKEVQAIRNNSTLNRKFCNESDPLPQTNTDTKSSLRNDWKSNCSVVSPLPNKSDSFSNSNVHRNEENNRSYSHRNDDANNDVKILKEGSSEGIYKQPNEVVLHTSSAPRNSMFINMTVDNQHSFLEKDKTLSSFAPQCQIANTETFSTSSNADDRKLSQNCESSEAKHCLPVPVEQQLKSFRTSSSKKMIQNRRNEIAKPKKESEDVCDNLDSRKNIPSEIKVSSKVPDKFFCGIYSHSEPQELDLMVKKKVNMSAEEIKRWINESSQSVLEHNSNCRYLENDVCECEYRNSTFLDQNAENFQNDSSIKTDNNQVNLKLEKEPLTTNNLPLQYVDHSSDNSENRKLKKTNVLKNIKVEDFTETLVTNPITNPSSEKIYSKNVVCEGKEMIEQESGMDQKEEAIIFKSVNTVKSQNKNELNLRTPIQESNKISSHDVSSGSKNLIAEGGSNLVDYSVISPQSPKDDSSFLNEVSSSNDETPEKCSHTERRSIFNQRRSILKVKERKDILSPSSNAFSPENESSVYAFEPDLPPASTPFRRSKGKDNKMNSSSTDELESVPSSNSIAVQVNFDNETVFECSTQTDNQEGDDDDPNTFYIPLQQNNIDVSKPPLIQGVAVKLDTEGPDQKVIMRAKLVTKPLSTFSQSSSGRAVIGSKSGKPEQKVRPLSVKLPVGTVQPTARPKPKPSTSEECPGPSKVASPQATRLAKRTKVKSAAATPTTSTSELQSPKVAPAKLVEAPTFYPTEKEFEDPLEYIESITPSAEKFGLCRVVPPSNFKPDCRVSDDMRFTAYNQYIHKMLHRWGPNVKEMLAIKKYLATQSISLKNPPLIGGMEVDLPRLYQTVQSCGGLKEVIEKKRWHRVADAMKIPKSAQDRVTKLDDIYCKFLLPYDTLSHAERTQLLDDVEKYWVEREKRVASSLEDDEDDDNSDSDIDECILKGRSMALNAFYRIARNTMSMWFNKTENPPASDVELEFWKHVASRQHHVCVHAGSIDSGSMNCGFPTSKNSSTSRHPWNLKMLTNNSGSILRFLGPIMGVTVPTLHVGMLFSACCWYRDPHGLPWIEYLHTGASKIWYGIPDSSSSQLRDAVESIVPRLCRNKTLWLASDTAMVPPPLLVERGVSLSRIVQDPGQFIIVFPKSYTSSICTGYLVSESVYFAQPSWLTSAHKLFNEMKESSEPTVFSIDKLLFSIVNDSRSSVSLLTQIYPIVVSLRDGEIAGRRQLEELGVNASERLNTNKCRKSRQTTEEEEDYECDECRTNLFISFMSNSHDGATYCLPHAVNLLTHKRNQVKYCSLVYSFSEDELEELVEKLKSRVENKNQKKVQSKSSKS